jgi:hypothetical protein
MLYQQTLPLHAGSVRVNAIRWSPLTTPLKADLCYDQTNKSGTCPDAEKAKAYPYKRAGFNRNMKDGLLDDCLADALIYQGKSRVGINERMQTAILQAVNTTGGKTPGSEAGAQSTTPMIVITDSLGSKITFDAIFKLASPTGRSKERIGISMFNRTTQIFMRANQMPILALADKLLDGTVSTDRTDTGFPVDPIQALFEQRNSIPGLKMVKGPNVVAFSDPNDLLSYALVGSPHAANADYPIIDVIVSTANTYLGLIELPNKAHTDYKTTDAVRQLIACGNPRWRDCKN